MKKLRTTITDDNEGMHSPTNYRKAMEMLLTHPYTIGLLYHLVLTGRGDKQPTRKDYQWAMKELCKELRSRGMPCMWKGCYELDEKKRFHFHAFILIEAKGTHPDSIMHYRKGHWLANLLSSRDIGFNIAPPQDPMHRVAGKQVNYMYVAKKGPKLEDALTRISYLYKVRSKAGVEGQIYTSSTNRGSAKARPVKQTAAPQAEPVQQAEAEQTQQAEPVAQEATAPATHTTDDKGAPATMMTTNDLPATAHAYLMGRYEFCVDKGLDVDQIRKELAKNGIRRTEGQVVFDLEHRYGFSGYAASHPAPARMTFAELDAIEDAKTAKPVRLLRRQVTGQASLA